MSDGRNVSSNGNEPAVVVGEGQRSLLVDSKLSAKQMFGMILSLYVKSMYHEDRTPEQVQEEMNRMIILEEKIPIDRLFKVALYLDEYVEKARAELRKAH